MRVRRLLMMHRGQSTRWMREVRGGSSRGGEGHARYALLLLWRHDVLHRAPRVDVMLCVGAQRDIRLSPAIHLHDAVRLRNLRGDGMQWDHLGCEARRWGCLVPLQRLRPELIRLRHGIGPIGELAETILLDDKGHGER